MPERTASLDTQSMLATGALRPLDTLGRFELRKVLGRGAQSTVWLAFDPRMEREVAIKVMRAQQGPDTRALTQWLDEARSVGRVKHPNIVPVYEADIHNQHPYLVFEYIAGTTLDHRLKANGAMAPQQAVAIMMDVLDAVAVAHVAGVIHRDLKPSNILVDTAGHARQMPWAPSPLWPQAERRVTCRRRPPTALRLRSRWIFFQRAWCLRSC